MSLFKDSFGCGNIYINKRFDNHNEDLYRYCVRSITDLRDKIIPFFNKHHLKTNKSKDFDLFCKAMVLIENREHLTIPGLVKIANLAMRMNRKVKPKFLESPLTICRTS